MKNRAVRALLVLLALAAMAGAGYWLWQVEGQMASAAREAEEFGDRTRQLGVDLAHLGRAQQAYVADGQDAHAWVKTATALAAAITTGLGEARQAARSPEAQGALEGAVETLAAFADTDRRAREYLDATQRILASDVIFADGSAAIAKAEAAVNEARLRESAVRATEMSDLRRQQLYALTGAAALTLLALLLLFPVPRSAAGEAGDGTAAVSRAGGLGLSQISTAFTALNDDAGDATVDLSSLDADAPRIAPRPPAAVQGPVTEVADICALLARVKEPRELPPLLERVATALEAAGLIIWMPDGPKGALRPVLAHGYPPLAITRMGTIATDADNATALAFRTRAQHVVPAETGSNAAVVSPLVTADGCSGVMAIELRPGVEASDHRRSLAAIVSAQLATLISPAEEGRPAGRGR
ncbi:MAG: hypothetical protein AB1806_21640 [Acidobacteriota bacterium]